jgi:hypothetical protein
VNINILSYNNSILKKIKLEDTYNIKQKMKVSVFDDYNNKKNKSKLISDTLSNSEYTLRTNSITNEITLSNYKDIINLTSNFLYSSFNFGSEYIIIDGEKVKNKNIFSKKRLKKNVLSANAFIIDIDEKNNTSIDKFLDTNLAKKYNFILTTSKSHTEEHNCFHVIFPFSEKINLAKENGWSSDIIKVDEYTKLLKYTHNYIETNHISCDNRVNDTARIIAPARRSDEYININTFKCIIKSDGENIDKKLLPRLKRNMIKKIKIDEKSNKINDKETIKISNEIPKEITNEIPKEITKKYKNKNTLFEYKSIFGNTYIIYKVQEILFKYVKLTPSKKYHTKQWIKIAKSLKTLQESTFLKKYYIKDDKKSKNVHNNLFKSIFIKFSLKNKKYNDTVESIKEVWNNTNVFGKGKSNQESYKVALSTLNNILKDHSTESNTSWIIYDSFRKKNRYLIKIYNELKKEHKKREIQIKLFELINSIYNGVITNKVNLTDNQINEIKAFKTNKSRGIGTNIISLISELYNKNNKTQILNIDVINFLVSLGYNRRTAYITINHKKIGRFYKIKSTNTNKIKGWLLPLKITNYKNEHYKHIKEALNKSFSGDYCYTYVEMLLYFKSLYRKNNKGNKHYDIITINNKYLIKEIKKIPNQKKRLININIQQISDNSFDFSGTYFSSNIYNYYYYVHKKIRVNRNRYKRVFRIHSNQLERKETYINKTA